MTRSFLAKPLILAITFGVLVAALFVADRVSDLVEGQQRALQHQLVIARAEGMRNHVQGELASMRSFARGLTASASARPEVPLATYGPLLEEVLRDHAYLRALVLRRDDQPPFAVARVGLASADLPRDAGFAQAEQQARASGMPVLAGPFSLAPSGTALVHIAPVALSGTRFGWVYVVMDLDGLLSTAGMFDGDTRFALRGNSGTAMGVSFGAAELFNTDAARLPMDLPGGSWELAVMPAQGWASESRVRVIGFATALMVALLTYVLLAEREREKQLALHDVLTGLPNRLFFDMRLEHAISRAERHGRPFALLYLDLDDFKPVNDVYGHKAGDRVLVETGRRIRRHLRRVDTVARIGGDEFMVILDDTSGPFEAEVVARKLIDALQAPIAIGAHTVRVGVSIGASFYPRSGFTSDELIRRADQAMYDAKSSGKNRVCFDAACLA
ncbi:MAG: sensor domain-containing diguanylate cyclase [Gammaproteobacteria bacterium]|nr:sensor domain-containing diguanylate cyclase [Gammaproteobacteria bacterium]